MIDTKNERFKNTDLIDERIRLSKLLNFSEVAISECFRTTLKLTNITFPTCDITGKIDLSNIPVGNPQFTIIPNSCGELANGGMSKYLKPLQ